ncbi:MAG: hypothetical protein HY286_04600 [Planctomycetes bacterium]|nr:hypothetical protein [Planctomycetota bacterium]
MTFDDFFWCIILPALASGALWVFVAFPLAPGSRVRAGASLAFSIAYILAHAGIAQWRGADVVAWLPWIAAGAGILGVVETRIAGAAGHAMRAVVSLGIPLLLVRPLLSNAAPPDVFVKIAPPAILIFIAWTATSRSAPVEPGMYHPILQFIIYCTASAVILFTHNLTLAELSGVLAAATGPAVVLSTWLRAGVYKTNGATAPLLIYYSILILAHDYGYTPDSCALLLGAAPALAAGPRLVLQNRVSDRTARFAGFACTAAALGSALAIAWSRWAPDEF